MWSVAVVVVFVDNAGFDIVVPAYAEGMDELPLDVVVVDGATYLYTEGDVARHPVGGGDEYLRIAVICEDEQPRML